MNKAKSEALKKKKDEGECKHCGKAHKSSEHYKFANKDAPSKEKGSEREGKEEKSEEK